MKQGQDDSRTVFQSFAMVMQFGLNMIVPIGMMSAIGIWLDGKLGTSWFTVVLFVVGAVAGGQNIYHMAKRICDTPETGGSGEQVKKQDKINCIKGGSCENNRDAEKDE